MQIDMHYYGTYAMARAAGIRPESAKIIATAAHFVDDAVMTDDYDCKDGSCIVVEATGHHSEDVRNLLPVDQRKVWLPFHFLPGNQGVSFLERLTCGNDSAVAREMIERNLASSNRPFARELIGITAHVYADTFAHYGFSGISSPLNRVQGGSIKVDVENPEIRKYITDKAGRFYRKYGAGFLRRMGKRIRALISETAETLSGALGVTYTNGKVDTCKENDLFYWPPGHSVRAVKDSEIILFSPQREHALAMDHMLNGMKG